MVPVWIDGRFNWSKPFITSNAIIVARKEAPAAKSLSELADKPIGTVIGYHYPEIERVLGKHFAREDAPSTELNLRKLLVGRMHYATVMTQCAFSLRSTIPFAQAEHAIDALVQDGSVAAVLNQYTC